MTIQNQEALNERANNLGSFNGIRLVLVSLSPTLKPTQAILSVYFYNNHQLSLIAEEIATTPAKITTIFPIMGGHRVLGGVLPNQVQVVAVATDLEDDSVLHLTVQPIGDYSTYTLSVLYPQIDPIFSEIQFKFRPGCFNYCAPDWHSSAKPKQNPAIDYLAKDYDSFRHTLFTGMVNRVPGWQPTSEVDLDQVLLSLFSVVADELSDQQDRVMAEAYWVSIRKRVSLARQARLMNYHIHQGNQASTQLAVQVSHEQTVDRGFIVWAGEYFLNSFSIIFMTRQPQAVHPLLNEMGLYTWSHSIPALAVGSTSADLKLSEPGQVPAETVRDLMSQGTVTHLLIQEHLNPLTGETRGRDPTQRQLLHLIPEETKALQDPVTGEWFVRVRWQEQDQLQRNYCFTVHCSGDSGEEIVQNVSLFHGNLLQVYHGQPVTLTFRERDDASLPLLSEPPLFYERTKKQGAICRLPHPFLAYQDTPLGGGIPPKSTLEVEVEGDNTRLWYEVIDLIHSDDSDERGECFRVETDELGRSSICFGNGINGKQLPDGARVHCTYQMGRGLDGNIGADTLLNFDGTTFPHILACWNPFDITNGREPESVAEILRCVPEAYRNRQLRAITLNDYKNRAEALPEVAGAFAQYRWIGHGRTVQIVIDPVGTSILTPELREKIARYLEAMRLIGEDLEIRPPYFVPLEIQVSLCINSEYWVEDIRFILEQEFSEGYTPDGRMAFFHPDRWTFGQALRASQIIGAVQAIPGVAHVIDVKLKRWNEATPGTKKMIEVRANEIIQVKNNPDSLESGLIQFEIHGGRQ